MLSWSRWSSALRWQISSRQLSVSSPKAIKQIVVAVQDEALTIEGALLSSPRAALLVRPSVEVQVAAGERKPCYFCALQLNVKHTDVLILSQFLRTDGCMLPRRVTGLCSTQQKRIAKMVQMAHKAGLMLNFTPEKCKKDLSSRKCWKKFNTYYDERTILRHKKAPSYADQFKTYVSGEYRSF